MKPTAKSPARKRVELGKYIVADSGICHGKPTFKGSRVMVWQVLAGLQRGETVDELCASWPHVVTPEAVAEAVQLERISFARRPRPSGAAPASTSGASGNINGAHSENLMTVSEAYALAERKSVVYGTYTEGFTTPDLVEAARLLESLA